MTQTRNGALDALQAAFVAIFVAPVLFAREPEKSPDASTDGVVQQFDGDPGEPEVLLCNPPLYCYEHSVELEITAKGEDRKTVVRALVALIEPKLSLDRTLGGAVDDARIVEAVKYMQFGADADGVETEYTAVVNVQLAYTAATAAN